MAQRAWAAALLWIHVDMNSYLLLQLRYNVLSFGSFFFFTFFRPGNSGADENTQMFSARCFWDRGDNARSQETQCDRSEQMEQKASVLEVGKNLQVMVENGLQKKVVLGK